MYDHVCTFVKKTVKATISPTCSNYVMNSTGKTIYSPKNSSRSVKWLGSSVEIP